MGLTREPKMDFYIGQTFGGTYPPDAAHWCNRRGDCHIERIAGGFQIVAVPEPTEEEKAAAELAQAKAERADAVSRITVEVDGMVFDGDELSQGRMSRTIAAAVALGVDLTTETRVWVLADNSIAQPTISQLAEALRKAGDAQSALWAVPYTE